MSTKKGYSPAKLERREFLRRQRPHQVALPTDVQAAVRRMNREQIERMIAAPVRYVHDQHDEWFFEAMFSLNQNPESGGNTGSDTNTMPPVTP